MKDWPHGATVAFATAISLSALAGGCGRIGFSAAASDGGIDATGDGVDAVRSPDGRDSRSDGAGSDGAGSDGAGSDVGSGGVLCGDGLREGAEVCDDGNSVADDGCENDCTPSCAEASDCDGGGECTTSDVCVDSRCERGSQVLDGTECGGGLCRAGACAAASCGDGTVDAGEDCDDRNTIEGDGCENDCSFSCEGPVDCDDGDPCNGSESCAGNRCLPSPPPALGTPCDRDGDAGTRDICLEAGCAVSRCGDDFEDVALDEECDDGNVLSGDGCSAACQVEASVCPDPLTTSSEEECFRGCAVNGDCVQASRTCCCDCRSGGDPVAINSAHVLDWEARQAVLCAGRDCRREVCPSIFRCAPGVSCVDGQCELAGAI